MNIIVKQDSSLLKKGDVFYFDADRNSYVYRNEEEDISKDTYKHSLDRIELSQDTIDYLIECGLVEYYSDEKEQPKEPEEIEDGCKCEGEPVKKEYDMGMDWEAYNLGLELKSLLNRIYGPSRTE